MDPKTTLKKLLEFLTTNNTSNSITDNHDILEEMHDLGLKTIEDIDKLSDEDAKTKLEIIRLEIEDEGADIDLSKLGNSEVDVTIPEETKADEKAKVESLERQLNLAKTLLSHADVKLARFEAADIDSLLKIESNYEKLKAKIESDQNSITADKELLKDYDAGDLVSVKELESGRVVVGTAGLVVEFKDDMITYSMISGVKSVISDDVVFTNSGVALKVKMMDGSTRIAHLSLSKSDISEFIRRNKNKSKHEALAPIDSTDQEELISMLDEDFIRDQDSWFGSNNQKIAELIDGELFIDLLALELTVDKLESAKSLGNTYEFPIDAKTKKLLKKPINTYKTTDQNKQEVIIGLFNGGIVVYCPELDSNNIGVVFTKLERDDKIKHDQVVRENNAVYINLLQYGGIFGKMMKINLTKTGDNPKMESVDDEVERKDIVAMYYPNLVTKVRAGKYISGSDMKDPDEFYARIDASCYNNGILVVYSPKSGSTVAGFLPMKVNPTAGFTTTKLVKEGDNIYFSFNDGYIDQVVKMKLNIKVEDKPKTESNKFEETMDKNSLVLIQLFKTKFGEISFLMGTHSNLAFVEFKDEVQPTKVQISDTDFTTYRIIEMEIGKQYQIEFKTKSGKLIKLSFGDSDNAKNESDESEDESELTMEEKELLAKYKELGTPEELEKALATNAEVTEKLESAENELAQYQEIGEPEDIIVALKTYAKIRLKEDAHLLADELNLPLDTVMDAIEKLESVSAAKSFLSGMKAKFESESEDEDSKEDADKDQDEDKEQKPEDGEETDNENSTDESDKESDEDEESENKDSVEKVESVKTSKTGKAKHESAAAAANLKVLRELCMK